VKLDAVDKKDFRTQRTKTLFAAKPSDADLKMKRTNEYATPTHSARTTRPYSVSFPVCME